MEDPRIIKVSGGYRKLKSFIVAEIIYDATFAFCRRLIDPKSRTKDQMIQAARSGKQNIAEGSRTAATASATELRLVSVARSSLEELLLDYEDFLRQNGLQLWDKDCDKALFIRRLSANKDGRYEIYRPYVEEKSPETAANTLICLINQANYLLDRQLSALEAALAREPDFNERVRKARGVSRKKQCD